MLPANEWQSGYLALESAQKTGRLQSRHLFFISSSSFLLSFLALRYTLLMLFFSSSQTSFLLYFFLRGEGWNGVDELVSSIGNKDLAHRRFVPFVRLFYMDLFI